MGYEFTSSFQVLHIMAVLCIAMVMNICAAPPPLSRRTPHLTVAKDGSGNFTTISEALSAMPLKYTGRYVIYVKTGVYKENVIVTQRMVNITMYGDGYKRSIITGNKNFKDGFQLPNTSTFAVLGDGFMAQYIGFINTAGPIKEQAVALQVHSKQAVFLNCLMEGYQDTLYAHYGRQFYRDCQITGTIDFIFGDATAVFQNCNIYLRKPLKNQENVVTAQGKVGKKGNTGFVLQNCTFLADHTFETEKGKFKSYLGRPWKLYSRTIVMESYIGDFISPKGWLEYDGSRGLRTLFYAEFNNRGPGSGTSGRVRWPGYRVIKREEATKFIVGPFLQGETWLTNLGIPVHFGLFT
ncbi:hypothetical protein RD792_015209 [Penstemon davidsonii]|uniref:Pectinesterase n=1 Tax=Penstemon davidsonii TaxID=160366 RepID=A0ABR0CSH7_9LAMI|nr:hypothetical protein RD792_015209 [Penstemon davidsonii]